MQKRRREVASCAKRDREEPDVIDEGGRLWGALALSGLRTHFSSAFQKKALEALRAHAAVLSCQLVGLDVSTSSKAIGDRAVDRGVAVKRGS
jgi:hypothetical protein